MNAEKWNPGELVVLNATYVGVGKRNRFFVCMCNRNCNSFIISIDIVFVVVVVMYQNRQVMATSFGCCWYSGDAPQSPDCWSSCNVWGKMVAGGMEGDDDIFIEDVCEDGI